MIDITEKCTGCRACEQLCSQKAISMVEDDEGFMFASIDQSKCIDCGLCYKRCPQNIDIKKSIACQSLAVRLKDDELLFKSASGGAFMGIARAWIEDGGVVYGVTYDSEWNACHVCANTLDDLKNIQSSKYVQANTLHSYSDIKAKLIQGKKVLFSGTACQVGGLKSFLKKDYDNLLTMDLICHGVNSPLLFKKYIAWLEKQKNFKIKEYNFRSKLAGWALNFSIKTDSKVKMHFCDVDPYYYRFLEGVTYRECCYECKYCTPGRVGDITIGDYWGIEKEHPDFYDVRGVSCMLINTDKGLDVWKKFSSNFYYKETTFEKISKYNSNLLKPTKRKDMVRDTIYHGIKDSDTWFEDSFAKTFQPSFKAKMKDLIPACLKLYIKKHLK